MSSDCVDSLNLGLVLKQPYVDPPQEKVDASERLKALRREMAQSYFFGVVDNDICSIVPSVDAHGSGYVAERDKRCEFISGHVHSLP